MRLSVLGPALAALLLASSASASEPAADEAAAVRKPLLAYLQGHATGDGSWMRQAFLPSARIEGIRDGKLLSWTVDEYVAGSTGKPAADEARRKRSIDRVDVTGNAAMARITLDYPAGKFTDYLLLLKVDGEWKIANKVWTRQASPSASP